MCEKLLWWLSQLCNDRGKPLTCIVDDDGDKHLLESEVVNCLSDHVQGISKFWRRLKFETKTKKFRAGNLPPFDAIVFDKEEAHAQFPIRLAHP